MGAMTSRNGLMLALAMLVAGAAAVRPLVEQAVAADDSRDGQGKEEKLNLRPIIGIISQLGDPAPKHHSYIASSYVKMVESAGARAVPILCDMSPKEVERRFKAVNGILIPGGAQDLRPGQPFFDTVSQLVDLAIAANDKGNYFPVHGTCLGFEALAIVASANHSILSEFDAENLPSSLFLTDAAADGKSRFFNSLPPQVVQHLQTRPYAMENHSHGLAWTAVKENPKLHDFYDVLSLSVDRVGQVYVSTMEAHSYPITGTQWHPEKNAFEWTPDKDIPHHPDAIEVTQEVANFFVSEARRNFHKPASQAEEEDLLIYNWAPEYTGKHRYKGQEVDFVESYFFPPAKELEAQLQQRRQHRSAAEAAVERS
ncbi:Gamma-glutamyl hydrolase A [Chlorella vulgaris]